MSKYFCCCFSLKTGAYIITLINLIGGIGELFGGIVELTYKETNNDNHTLFIVCILLGISTISGGLLLTFGILQSRERYILLYILLGSVNLFILTIYTGINMFQYNFLLPLFALCVLLWYGQFSIYNFYEEVSEYNTVNSGVIEIAYNANTYVNAGALNDEAVENTAV